MGGNVVLPSGEAAQKVNIKTVGRTKLIKMLTFTIKDFNTQYEEFFKQPLWKDIDKLIKKGLIFSGSTRSLFNTEISDIEFQKYKPKIGDIDLQLPSDKIKNVAKFLKTKIGKKIGEFKYLGEGGNSFSQINGIFETPKEMWDKVRFLQIDFEPTHFQNDEPNEFSIFGHYSSFTDIKNNIKGLFSKYLWRVLISKERMGDIVVLSKRGKPSKSIKFINPGRRAFSVDKGVRLKFEPILDDQGKTVITNGKPTYKETTTENKNYHQNLELFFSIAFGKLPKENERKNMFSFVRTLFLMKKYLSDSEIEEVFINFIELLWGKGGQVIERDNYLADKEIKLSAYNKFLEVFSFLKSLDVKTKAEDKIKFFYYKFIKS